MKKVIKLTAVAMVGILAVSSVIPSIKTFAFEKTKGWSYGDVDKDGKVDVKDAMKVLQFYTEELSQNGTQSLFGADVTLDGRIDCQDANEILVSYVNKTLSGSEYFMPCECPILIGTILRYSGTQAWFRYAQPKTASDLGTIIPGNELQIVGYCGSEWYEIEIDGSKSFVNIPEGEIGQTFLVCTNEFDQTTSATTTTTEVTTSTSTTTSATMASTTSTTTTSATMASTTSTTTTSATMENTTSTTTTSATMASTISTTTTSATLESTTSTTTTSATMASTTSTTLTSAISTSTTTTNSTITTTTNLETTPDSTAQMFRAGQYIKILENYHFTLKDDSNQDVKWLIGSDVVKICSFVDKRDNLEEYMVKIISYHAPLFGFNPETELHMLIPDGSNWVELIDEPQAEGNTTFEVKDYVCFKGVGWKLLDENQKMTGKYLENSNRFSIEDVVLKDEKGAFYKINVSIDIGEFETAYIYICSVDKDVFFELTDHI